MLLSLITVNFPTMKNEYFIAKYLSGLFVTALIINNTIGMNNLMNKIVNSKLISPKNDTIRMKSKYFNFAPKDTNIEIHDNENDENNNEYNNEYNV
jgi:hypothetical protein